MAFDRNKALQEGVGNLQDAHKTTANTHQVALDIIGTMQDQGLQIQAASNHIDHIKENAQVSRKYINTMERRECIYRTLLIFVVALLFALILSLLYFKFTRHYK